MSQVRGKIEPEKLALFEAQVQVLTRIDDLQHAFVNLWAAYLGDRDPAMVDTTLAVLMSHLNSGLQRLGGEVRDIRIRYYGSNGPNVRIELPDLQELPPINPPNAGNQGTFPIKYVSFLKGTGHYRPTVAHLYKMQDAYGRLVTNCGRRSRLPHVHADVVTDRAICRHCLQVEESATARALLARDRAEKETANEQEYETPQRAQEADAR